MAPATADAARWRSLGRLLVFVLLMVGLSLALSLVITPFVTLPWWKVFRRCVSIAALLSLFVMRRQEQLSWESLGLTRWKAGSRQFAMGLGLALGAAVCLAALYLSLGVWRASIDPNHVRVWLVLTLSVPAMALVAVLEEVVFRGYVMRHVLPWGQPLAVLVTSAAYSLVHLRSSWVWPSTALELVGLYVLGTVLAISVLRTQQLWMAIGMHAVLAYAARVNKLVVEIEPGSLTSLVGSHRLINGMAAWGILAILGWCVLRWAPRVTPRHNTSA